MSAHRPAGAGAGPWLVPPQCAPGGVARFTAAAALAASSVLLTACVTQAPRTAPAAPVEPAAPGLGLAKGTAIEVCRPQGERAYLNQLECPDGARPRYRRVGSFGPRTAVPTPRSDAEAKAQVRRALSARALRPGEPDIHIVDGYEVVCGGDKYMIYIDMYHCEQPPPTEAPPGFRLRPARRIIVSY